MQASSALSFGEWLLARAAAHSPLVAFDVGLSIDYVACQIKLFKRVTTY